MVATAVIKSNSQLSATQVEEAATLLRNDDNFLRGLARDISKDETLITTLKTDDGFRGEDGGSPSARSVATLLLQEKEFLANIRTSSNGVLAGHCAVGNPKLENYENYNVVPPATAIRVAGSGWKCDCESGWSLVRLGSDYYKTPFDALYFSCIKS